MPRTRDGFVPLGDVSQAVALPGDRALTHRATRRQRDVPSHASTR